MDSYGYERNKGWMLIGQKHEANLDVCTRMRFWVTDGGTSKLTRLFWIQGNGEALTSMTDWCGCSRSSGLRRNPLALFTPRPPPRPPRVRPLRHQHQKSPAQLPAEHICSLVATSPIRVCIQLQLQCRLW